MRVGAKQTANGSTYAEFFRTLARSLPRRGFRLGVRLAREQAGVDAPTASRWIASVDLDVRQCEGIPGRRFQRGLPDFGERYADHRDLLIECLRVHHQREWHPNRRDTLESDLTVSTEDSEIFWVTVVRARAIASLLRGDPFPSWLDRASRRDDPDGLLPRNAWAKSMGVLRKLDRRLEELTPDAWWTDSPGWLREWFTCAARRGQIVALLRRAAEGPEGSVVPNEGVDALFTNSELPRSVDRAELVTIVRQVLESVRLSLRGIDLARYLSPDDLRDGEFMGRFRSMPRKPRKGRGKQDWEKHYSARVRERLRLDSDRNLQYWMSTRDQVLEIRVLSRQRLVGYASARWSVDLGSHWCGRLQIRWADSNRIPVGEAIRGKRIMVPPAYLRFHRSTGLDTGTSR